MHTFLQNPHLADIGAALRAWLAAPRSPEYCLYALADMSILDATALKKMERLSAPGIALLEGSRYTAYEELGPRLFPLSPLEPPAVERFIGIASGLPALSFVELLAPEGSPDRRGLVWLAEAETSDGLLLYCRFTDTRILPGVLQVLDRAQIGRLGHTVRRWAWVGRDGGLHTRDFPCTTSDDDSATDVAIQFSDAQFAALMQAAECDTVYQMLREVSPEIVPVLPPVDIYRRLDALLRVARGYGLTEAPDQLQFVSIAWSSSERFHELECLGPTWAATCSGGQRFGDAVKEWPDAIWDGIEVMTNNSIPVQREQDSTASHQTGNPL